VAQQRQRGPAVPARAWPSAAASARPSRGQLARQRQTGRAWRGARAGWQAGGRGAQQRQWASSGQRGGAQARGSGSGLAAAAQQWAERSSKQAGPRCISMYFGLYFPT